MARVRMPGLLDGELQEIARLRVRAGQYQLSADDVSQATLTIPEDGPVVGLRDWVSLYDEDGLMGVYRVTNIAQTVKRSIQLTLLHGIDILADSYWAEEREYTGNVRGYLEALLAQQTALIDGTAPWALGDCEDTETTLKGVKISYGRLSELIREAVPEGGGYQLEYDQTVWPWRVHVRAKPTAAAAEFRVARNITSATVTYNDADLCTRLILSNTSGGESRVRVYNAGAIAQAEWGIVTMTASIDTSDTLTSESWPEAEAWVAAFFALHAAPSVQIQIEGRELYRLTGDRWDRASLGRVCRVSLPEYGHVFEERVVSLTYPDPWGDPDRVVVSLANALPQFSEQVKLIEKTARSASRAAGGAARKADQTAEELERKEVIYQTSFQKTDREIAGIASATGLQFNADGTPVLDEDGNFVYSETHPDNALIAQISLQAGRYDRIIQATGISETPSQGEVSLVTQISQTHQIISQEATATGLIWVEGDPTADPPTEGHYEVNPSAVSSSLYKQLANQITQSAQTVTDNITARGYVTAVGAKNAAWADIGAELKDSTTGVITSAKIKALVEGDTSLIQLVADKVVIDGDTIVSKLAGKDISATSFTGSTGNFTTLTTGTLKLTQGSGTVDVARKSVKIAGVTLSNLTLLGTGSDVALTIPDMVIDTQVIPDGNGFKLQKKMQSTGAWADAGSFSRAASIQTVSGSWSGSTYQIVADANGTALPLNETLTFTVGTTPSGGASSTTIDRFSSLHKNTLTVKGSSQPSAAYIKQYIIDASGVYSDGETAGRTQAVTDATLSVDAPFVLNGVIKIYPRVTFDADTEKSANPMDAQLPALATNSSGTPTAAPSTLVAGSTVYPYVQIGSVNFFGSGYTVPSSAAVNVESSHPHTMSANTETVTPSNGYDAMAQVVVDATPRYYAGKAAVTLSDTPTWGTTPSSNITAAQNTVTVSTSGRTNTSGTADERTKTINLYSNVTKSGLTATFYVTHTNSTDANRIIKRETTFSDSNLTAENIKSGVSIFGVTGSYTGSGGGSYGVFHGFTDEPVVSGEYTVYPGGTINGSKTIYAVIENSYGTPITGPSITVSAPTQPTIGPKSTTITSNGTYYASDDSKNGWSQVTVSVSSSTYSHNAQTNQISTDQIYVYYQGTYMTYRQRYGTDRYVCYTTTQLGSTVYW